MSRGAAGIWRRAAWNDATWRYEFCATVELPSQIDNIAEHIDAFQHLYNHHRPHGAFDGKTYASIEISAETE